MMHGNMVVSPGTCASQVINFLLGWLVYHEDLPMSRLAGFALVWIGLIVMTVDTVQRRARHGRSPEPVAVV